MVMPELCPGWAWERLGLCECFLALNLLSVPSWEGETPEGSKLPGQSRSRASLHEKSRSVKPREGFGAFQFPGDLSGSTLKPPPRPAQCTFQGTTWLVLDAVLAVCPEVETHSL